MKKYRWITAGVVGLVALAAGGLSYFCFQRPMSFDETRSDTSFVWLKTEFKLSDDQFARVRALHEAYESVCVESCQAIVDSRDEVRRLREAHAPQEEIAAAMAKTAAIDAHCVDSTRKHVREIAAVIGGREGERYLSLVLPRIVSFDHAAPVSLDMRKFHLHDAPGRK